MRQVKDKDHPKILHKLENNSSAEAFSETEALILLMFYSTQFIKQGFDLTVSLQGVKKKNPTISFLLNSIIGCFEGLCLTMPV